MIAPRRPDDPRVAVVILAGGESRRLPGPRPKPFRALGGRPVVAWSLSRALALSEPVQGILVTPSHLQEEMAEGIQAICPQGANLSVVAGGKGRQESVRAALDVLVPSVAWVLVHDAARPFASLALFEAVLAAARLVGAATAALTPSDALRWAEPPKEGPLYLPREELMAVQTPQAFARDLLVAAHEGRITDAPDDASLVSRLGHPVALVPGEPGNFKITTSGDWEIAQGLASASQAARQPRIGHGHDVHRLAAGRPLFLCGVEIPAPRGLVGHSDADVACHASADALLGAAGLGDLGTHFPPGEPRWRDLSGTALLGMVRAILDNAGWTIGNLDLTILVETPRVAPYRERMREALAAALHIAVDQVSVKASTLEGLDAVGARTGIAAHAVALILPRAP